MNKLIFLSILALIIISCENKHAASSDARFRGLWKLDEFEAYDSISGKWVEDTTHVGYSGYILYDGLGHMAVHLMPKEYNDFDPDKNHDSLNYADVKLMAKIYQSNYVYFADYKTENGKISHSKLSATNPKDKGSISIREFEFKADTLILKPMEKISGLKLRLRWIKLK